MMLIRSFGKLIVFWVCFFVVQQAAFLAINFSSFKGTGQQLLTSFLTALPMDLSATAYLMALPVLAFIAGNAGVAESKVNIFVRSLLLGLLVVVSLVGAADMGLYKVWGTKMNAKALGYLKYPKEVLPTMFAFENLGLLLVMVSQIFFGWWLLKRLQIRYVFPAWKISTQIIFAVLSIGLLVLGFRGGFQRVPINRNWVFQSEHSILNYGALNGFWNSADLLFRPLEKQENPYRFMPDAEAMNQTLAMYHASDTTTIPLFNTAQPNIVIVFLESWATDVIHCLGGEEGVAPHFDELVKEGLLLDHFYSTGFRTEQGYLATLSAQPALPVGSIMQSFGKFDKLPNLYQELQHIGYHTSFYTGGRLFFDNVESYLRAAGVNTIKGENEWEIHKRTVWGAYDEETFSMHLKELSQQPQPFFSAVATMTTHEWFDANVPQLFHKDADAVNDKYRNTMHYADSCLFAYVKQAQQMPAYRNTVFILMADHACRFPKNRNNFDPERHHIPMLILGGALRSEWVGKTWNRIGSHTDIPATLLAQLHASSAQFPLSKNLFAFKAPAFAYYTFDNGFGLVTDSLTWIYDHNRNNQPGTPAEQALDQKGKALLQYQYQQSIDLGERKHL